MIILAIIIYWILTMISAPIWIWVLWVLWVTYLSLDMIPEKDVEKFKKWAEKIKNKYPNP